jgi:ABC-type transport system involved in multi-copper enzyme maturation permease subunit
MKLLAIIEATVREGIARKTILGMFIVSTVTILLAIFLFQLNAVQHGLLSPAQGHVQMGHNAQPMQLLGMTVLDMLWMGVAAFLLFLSIFMGSFVTAGFVTSLMEKGTIDLLLSKPVDRWVYIAGRYVGAVFIILAEVAYLVLGLWLVAGFSLGVWNTGFLASMLVIGVAFAGVYSLVTLFGVLTRSSWFAIIIVLALYILVGFIIPFGKFIDRLTNGEPTEGPLSTVATGLQYIMPARGLNTTMSHVITSQSVSLTPIFLTAGLAIVYLAASCFVFSKKEF